MTDQTTDTTDPFTAPDHAAVKNEIDTILSLDQILSAARFVERTVRICVDGTLADAYDAVIRELSGLVDADGNVLEEAPLGGSRAKQLNDQASQLREQMNKATLAIKFRALPSDEYQEFDKSHRNSQGGLKDVRRWENNLITKCAITPELPDADVEKLRKALNRAQFAELLDTAVGVNVIDGIDIPKSPSFLAAPKPQE